MDKIISSPRGSGKSTIHKLLKQHEEDTRELAILYMRNIGLAQLVNRLANIILDNKITDNDRYEAEIAIAKVLPLL